MPPVAYSPGNTRGGGRGDIVTTRDPDVHSRELSVLQIEVRYDTRLGAFAGSGRTVQCRLTEGVPAFAHWGPDTHGSSTARLETALITLSTLRPGPLVLCRFLSDGDPVTAAELKVISIDAQDANSGRVARAEMSVSVREVDGTPF